MLLRRHARAIGLYIAALVNSLLFTHVLGLVGYYCGGEELNITLSLTDRELPVGELEPSFRRNIRPTPAAE